MNRLAKVAGTGAVVVGGTLLARQAYAATHPGEARFHGEVPATAPPDRLLAMPGQVADHEIPSPDGGTIAWAEAGEGRPLVLLHGITLRHDVWAPQFHQLADRYRVIAVDLRGHGRSVAGSDGFGLPRLGQDLVTLLDELAISDAIVVGHSMGGMALMRFCGDHPDVVEDRVAGVVFLASAGHNVIHPALSGAAGRLSDRSIAAVERRGSIPRLPLPVADRMSRLAFGNHPSRRAVRIVSEMGAAMDPRSLMLSGAGLLEHDARDALRMTRTPSLVVVGTRDLLTPVPAGRNLARILPNSDFVILPKCGHQVMQERPDELGELLDSFVERIEEDTPLARAVDEHPGPVEGEQVEEHHG